MKTVLASASPRRRELIRLIDPDALCVTSGVQETVPDGLPAGEIPAYLACRKAEDVAKTHPDALVIGADTVVLIDDAVLGKPHSAEEATAMLRRLSGRTHTVITGCALFARGRHVTFSNASRVTFWPLSEEEIHTYVDTGEPMDKAGAYGIQEQGALLVKRIEGDYFNVVGLPVSELARQIQSFLFSQEA